LPLVVADLRKLKTLEGRVLAHGEEEVGKAADRHYLLLDGTEAKYISLLEDSGDAERVLRNDRHLTQRAKVFLTQEIIPLARWGGWLGRYQAAVKRTAAELIKLQIDRHSGVAR
jgi:hypothetical protein